MLISFLIASFAFAALFNMMLQVPATVQGYTIRLLVYAYMLWTVILIIGVAAPMITESGLRLI